MVLFSLHLCQNTLRKCCDSSPQTLLLATARIRCGSNALHVGAVFGAVFVTFVPENISKMLRFVTANVAISYRPNLGRQQRVTFWCRSGAVFVTFLPENVCKMLRSVTTNVAMSYRPNLGRQQRVTFWCRFGAVFVTFLPENVCKMLRFVTANVAMSHRKRCY